ncbi:MAG: hypothetical protein U5L04_17260 [Trueperaceae bacterium]|nr:hypothetical protein [Trueperaceae bacterium]
MSLISREELKTLSQYQQGPAVSIYMPTHMAGADTRENAIRLKTLLQDVRRQLGERGFGSRDVQEVLEPADALVDDNNFWQHQRHGFAMFIANGDVYQYKLPISVEEYARVSDRFYLKPLLPLLTGDGRFHLLAVSLNGVRMFEGSRDNISEVELDDAPTSLAEALRYDDPEKALDYYVTGRAGGGGGADSQDAVFQGTGAGQPDRKNEILRFFKQLDNGIRDMIAAESDPLVFAGVDYLFPLYQEANHYPHLVDESVKGNPDELSAQELHAKAWEVVKPHFEQGQQEARERFHNQHGTGLASEDIRQIIPAAADGQIDTLFVALGERVFGRYNSQSRSLEIHDERQEGDHDLLDMAAVQTLLHGGTIYATDPGEVPGDDPRIAAVFRYAFDGSSSQPTAS